MAVLDTELENNPTDAKVARMAELRIRNLLCFSELQSFNDTGQWRNTRLSCIGQKDVSLRNSSGEIRKAFSGNMPIAVIISSDTTHF